MSSRYLDPKKLQVNGTQFKTVMDEKLVYTTLYDVNIPKMTFKEIMLVSEKLLLIYFLIYIGKFKVVILAYHMRKSEKFQ